jgi:ABC-type transport system substrate-binding protein
MILPRVTIAALCGGVVAAAAAPAKTCKKHNIDFILNSGDSELATIEDDIRANLEQVGFVVNTRKLTKDAFNAAHKSGDFHVSFSETWGAPYDPHSYASAWITGNEGHKQALTNLEPPLTRDALFARITAVLKEEDHGKATAGWKTILNDVHQQAIMLPLWGKRIPTVMSKRLGAYQPGAQQFDYPVHKVKVLSGSKTVTIAPGAQTGRFKTVGPLEAHTYRPNEFFASNWIYEGLVAYSATEGVVPALAQSWAITDLAGADLGKQQVTFTLRSGVKFHDGTDWNCAAAKLNFDHVFAPPFVSADWHGWYQLPFVLDSWRCDSATQFTLVTKSKYAPLLQELSYIRPLRMVSPAAFANGAASDPLTHNSCRASFGTATGKGNGAAVKTLTCKGITAPIGTGPFKFTSRTKSAVGGTDADADSEVVFNRHVNYWGGAPEIEVLKIKFYADSASIKSALVAGTLDMMWGGGAMAASDLISVQNNHRSTLNTYHTDALQNVMLVLNSGAVPTNDIQIRKTLIHAINKVGFIDKELLGLQQPVDTIFPRDAPFCNVDLTPKWDYDFEKAVLLNCPKADDKNKELGLGLGFGLVAAVLLAATLKLRHKNKELEYKLVNLKTPAAPSATDGQTQVVVAPAQANVTA